MTEAQTSIVVLASGRGSNFEAILNSIQKGVLSAKVTALISNKEDAKCLSLAASHDIPSYVIQENEKLLNQLKELSPQFVVLAGYMKILPKEIIQAFDSKKGYSRIVNIHPSLLPAFPGIHSYNQAYEYGSKITGITVHLVDEGVDQGPICAQESFSIEGLSLDEIENQGLQVEHRLYSETLEWVLKEKFVLEKINQRSRCVRQS